MRNCQKFAALFLLLSMLICAPATAKNIDASCRSFPLWEAFQKKYIQQDGRVIDYQISPGITTSEGQAYALFFALVANDQPQFEKLLQWTQLHLAQGNLMNHLPAWRWGLKPDGSWGVIDSNSASDADIWIVYALLEAGRLWQKPDYTKLGLKLLALITNQEVADVPQLGRMLLPGKSGFKISRQRWIFNSSYYPLQILKRISAADTSGVWLQVTQNANKMLIAVSVSGYSPDWSIFREQQGWIIAADKGTGGSYDAIRVYLWAGMLHRDDPDKKTLMAKHTGMLDWLMQGKDAPPETIDTQTGVANGVAPAGFSAALLPYLMSFNKPALAQTQLSRIQKKSHGILIGEQQHYYDQVLGLFGLGWYNGKYRFDRNGYLIPGWLNNCSAQNKP